MTRLAGDNSYKYIFWIVNVQCDIVALKLTGGGK